MALAEFNLRQLLEAGVHFGHQKKRWNPLMDPYIYGSRNGIHIIDLTQTVPLLDAALNVVTQTVAKGGSILFVGTKRQAQKPIAEAAEKSAQYYMNHRWLGGTLTNWKTVSNSISRLKKIDEQLQGNTEGLTKKERLNIEREQAKLQASLGGIRDMGGTPDLVFVIDTNKEALAIEEAKKLGIPVIAILDTNSDPVGIDFPIPGNDDASRSISLYCDLVARAALDGMESQLGAAGVDIGEMSSSPDLPVQDLEILDKDPKESSEEKADGSIVIEEKAESDSQNVEQKEKQEKIIETDLDSSSTIENESSVSLPSEDTIELTTENTLKVTENNQDVSQETYDNASKTPQKKKKIEISETKEKKKAGAKIKTPKGEKISDADTTESKKMPSKGKAIANSDKQKDSNEIETSVKTTGTSKKKATTVKEKKKEISSGKK